jgi:lysozyme family protein
VASFDVCFNWMLNFEDFNREYAEVPDAPPGAFAISGINSAAWPQDFEIIANTPQDQRAGAVQAFYQDEYWNDWLAQIVSDDVAKRVFDAAVNMGGGTATRLLQEAVNACGGNLTVDGQFGTGTLAGTNSVDSATLVTQFQQVRSQHYKDIVAKNPADVKYLNGWLARAEA